MNKHLANMQPGVRLILATVVLGLEFLLTQLSLSGLMFTLLSAFFASIHAQYKFVQPILLHSKNKAGRLKQRIFGVRISMLFALTGMAIMIGAMFENTPEQVLELQSIGHYLYVIGVTFFIAYIMGYNRVNQWFDEERLDTI